MSAAFIYCTFCDLCQCPRGVDAIFDAKLYFVVELKLFQAIQMMGGEILGESEEGKESTFTVAYIGRKWVRSCAGHRSGRATFYFLFKPILLNFYDAVFYAFSG
jgi:hypothetical protein